MLRRPTVEVQSGSAVARGYRREKPAGKLGTNGPKNKNQPIPRIRGKNILFLSLSAGKPAEGRAGRLSARPSVSVSNGPDEGPPRGARRNC